MNPPSNMPGRCRLVFKALDHCLGETTYTRIHAKFRYIDVVNITNSTASERRLRELVELCPGLVSSEDLPGDHKGQSPKHFWLTAHRPQTGAPRLDSQDKDQGELFYRPQRGRPE